MIETDSKLVRIGVFYDGNYFFHVSNYYNYVHPRRARLNIGGLHRFIKNKVAEMEGVDLKYCQVVDAHYFRGRLTAYEANNRNKLLSDRIFDDILMREGVVTHYLPLSNSGEKGIDVWLALEAFELAQHKKFNVVVLIACDGDYIPLVRKINTLGTRVMVLGWDFEYQDENGNTRTTTTSVGLLEEVTYPIPMHEIIDNKTQRNNSIVNDLFVQKEVTAKPFIPVEPGKKIRKTGRISALKNGFGFIAADSPPGANLYFNWNDLVEGDFNDLMLGDTVEFSLGANKQGQIAIEVVKVPPGHIPNMNVPVLDAQ